MSVSDALKGQERVSMDLVQEMMARMSKLETEASEAKSSYEKDKKGFANELYEQKKKTEKLAKSLSKEVAARKKAEELAQSLAQRVEKLSKEKSDKEADLEALKSQCGDAKKDVGDAKKTILELGEKLNEKVRDAETHKQVALKAKKEALWNLLTRPYGGPWEKTKDFIQCTPLSLIPSRVLDYKASKMSALKWNKKLNEYIEVLKELGDPSWEYYRRYLVKEPKT
ncbi:MAG: hypothetical protein KGJ02_01860 [Verrucomicrobiota bacterium]|nr:hypothetical protein [Verrucomicrobiota bacterium]